MDFKQIEAFANVVKYKSFSKAADASFLTQPTISAHISNLEKELDMPLLDRRTKRVQTTLQGKIFYKYAVSMLNTRAKAVYSLKNANTMLEGVLEIQASSIPGQYFVPQLMAEFHKKFPEVKFYLEQSDSSVVIQNLAEQKGEIGFTGKKTMGTLNCEPIFQDQTVLITPNSGIFAEMKKDTITIKDFIQEPFIWREEGSATRKEFENVVAQSGHSVKSLNVVARMNNSEAIRQAVAFGLGISIVSRAALGEGGCDPRIRAFSIDEFSDERTFYLVYSKHVALSPAAEAFRDFVLETYGEKQ